MTDSFTVRLEEKDWDENIGGWHCSALVIPSASVRHIYAKGSEVDSAKYKVDISARMIRWSSPAHPASIAVEVELQKKLKTSIASTWITAATSILTAIITAVATYYAAVDSSDSVGSSNPTQMAQPDFTKALDLNLLLGEVDGKSRGRIVSATENDKLLAQKFATAQRSIKVVAETGSTWLLAFLEPALNGAVKKDVNVEVLTHDFRNKDIFEAIQQSALGNGLTAYETSHYKENLKRFEKYYAGRPNFKAGVHRFYPWTRFTIFDDQAVSFVFTPTLNGGSNVQRMYSEDKVVVSMFGALYNSIREGSQVFPTASDLHTYAQNP